MSRFVTRSMFLFFLHVCIPKIFPWKLSRFHPGVVPPMLIDFRAYPFQIFNSTSPKITGKKNAKQIKPSSIYPLVN